MVKMMMIKMMMIDDVYEYNKKTVFKQCQIV